MDLNAKTKKENDVADDYLSSLSDLNCNSKPLINMLTMLAEENMEYAAVIVKVVDQHIAKVPADFKLPILYLIDSIVKNVKGTYVQLFSQCIVNIFCGVFEKVNEKVRERMYALRQTWNEVFLTQKLYALDVKIKRIDNNWPITAKQPQPSIHVNPNFLKTVSAGQAATLPSDMEEILHAKTRELLELKKRKLELELEATKKHLEEQEKQLTKATESVMPPVEALALPPGHIRGNQTHMMMPPGMMPPVGQQQHPGMRPGMYHNRNPRPLPQHIIPTGMNNIPPQQGYPSMANAGKPKVHPVNPALLNTIRHRDPRLARQQQQQQQQLQLIQTGRNSGVADAGQIQSVRGVSGTSSQISAAAVSASTKSEGGGKSNTLSAPSSSYRSSSKSSRAGGSASASSEGKAALTRHSSSRSAGSSSSSSKSKSSRSDKDTNEQRKRSESKSSTTSSSSTGSGSSSSSTERRKNKHQLALKCDKDAFEIAPLSTTFKRKSSSPTGGDSSPTKTRDAKRSSKSRNYAASVPMRSKTRLSRSPSPEVHLEVASVSMSPKDVDLRALANVAVTVVPASPEKRFKLSSDAERREEASSSPPTIASTAVAPNTTTKELDKNNKNVLEPMVGHLPVLPSSMMDIDLRQQLSPAAAVAAAVASTSVVVVPETSRAKTVATSSPKVSFKIQKLFNKLEKSTEHLSTASYSTTTTAANHANALVDAAVAADSFKAPQLTRRKTNNNDYADDEENHIGVSSDLANCKQSEPMAVDIIIIKDDDDGKKRPSAAVEPEEPLAKKSKSAKLDMLFGSEDVDLRSLMPPQMLAAQKQQQQQASSSEEEICPPPPPLTKEKESSAQHTTENWDNIQTIKSPSLSATNASPPKKSSLDDVRAKLARQTAKYNKFGKFGKFSNTNAAENQNQLRRTAANPNSHYTFIHANLQRLEKSNKELSQRFKLAELNQNDDTQEVNDEKIRTIITQAQELLQSNSINQEQYRSLVQTVMSINETNKQKEAKRREVINAAASSPPPKMTITSSSSPLTRQNDEDEHSSVVVVEEEEESLSDVERKAAREAVLKKRIPKLPKTSTAALDSKSCSSPLSDGGGGNDSPLYDSPNDEGNAAAMTKEKRIKEKRLKKQSKWGERIDPATAANNLMAAAAGGALPSRVWPSGAPARFRGSVPHPPLPPLGNPHLRMPPWHQQPPPHFMMMRGGGGSGNVPPPPLPPIEAASAPIIPKPCNSIDNPQADLQRSITIDGLAKEIRIYDQVAIVFMEPDQPREIGFQAGQRSIIIDNQPPLALQFNDDYLTSTIGGELARIRFGCPSRELYIDEHWYEIYFGGPAVTIPLRQRLHTIKAEGPPPQVNIGPLRRDLVVGKINMIVDAYTIVPLFLDARAQCFRLGDNEHTLQFADQLATVLLDGEPTRVEYGGLPKSLTLGGKKYFVRFGALPQGVVVGNAKIRDMIYVNMEKPQELEPELPKIELKPADVTMISAAEFEKTGADIEKSEEKALTTTTTSTEPAQQAANSAVVSIPNLPLNNFNIDELFKKLVSSGILGGNKINAAAATSASSFKSSAVLNALVADIPVTATASPLQEHIRPVDLAKSETIKMRQSAVVSLLFSGLQCSSCGVRFPPEQTIKYSQHLDWHFRQNRRERDSTRKAHSRKWYYDLNDWLQYEEIEDVEEREKNLFETQSNDAESALDDASASNQRGSPVPSCAAAGPDDVDRSCDMCQERFEQFYNEELDEWRLRSAIRVDAKIYHPLCYEDYKTSLNPPKAEETHTELINGDDDNAVDVIIKIEEDRAEDESADVEKASVTIADDDDDDDDVIVLPNEEPSVTEIDDDEEEYVPLNVTREDMGTDNDGTKTEAATAETVHDAAMESDVEIQEPNIPFTDLDTYEEKELPEGGDDASQMSFTNIKIKEEPNDDDEDEDDGFEDVGTVVIAPDEEISIQSSEDTQSQTIDTAATPSAESRPPSATPLSDGAPLDTNTTEIAATTDPTASVDLNLSTINENLVEPEDEHNLSTAGPAPAIPLASLVNRIKINITKNNIISSTNSSSSNSATTTTTTTNPLNNIINCNESTTSTIPVLCSGSSGAGDSSANAATSSLSSVSSISVIGSYGSASSSSFHAQVSSKVVVAAPAAASPRLPTPPPAAPPVEETITYELKPALQKATLKKAKKVHVGVETSGLCSIM